MLKLSAYLPSVENHDDMPSPLMDGDAVPAVVAPIAEINQDVLPGDDLGAVQVVDDISTLPVEEIVELPPHLDPTPMQPLEGEVIQEELIAENLDTEAGQLLGAQIAMEGYSVLLRSAGKNMTRQSAAFMAVGMRRAARLVPGVSLGMEDESSGTQVMAMQQAKVDEKGLGSKIAEVASKIWEWLKQKAKQLVEFIRKLGQNKEKQKQDVVYLIAASQAVESGNPAKVKNLEAPSGIKIAQVLDAIHGEDVRAPKQRTVKLPAKFVPFLTRDGKLDLNLNVENEVRNKLTIQYLKDATGLVTDIATLFKGATTSTTPEEVADKMSDLVKKHLGGKPGKWELHGMTVTRDDAGKLTAEKTEASEAEVTVPSPQEIRRYLEDVKKILDSESTEGVAVADAYLEAQTKMMMVGDEADKKFPQEQLEAIVREMGKVLKGNSFEDVLRDIHNHLDMTSTIALKASDFFLSALLGKDNTISQEDFERLPSRGLSVIEQPAGPGMMRRAGTAINQGWQKIKAFFAKLWQQFVAWAQGLWDKITGVEQKTDILLLTNAAVSDDGQASGGNLPQLPPGTRLKSVQATRMLGGPSAAAAPEITQFEVNHQTTAPTNVPAGFVFSPDAAELVLPNGQFAIDPTWEEGMVTWISSSYGPGIIRVMTDLVSYAKGTDLNQSDWKSVVDKAVSSIFQGMPETLRTAPGNRELIINEGAKMSHRQSNYDGELFVKMVNQRGINQALSRQKKLLTKLGSLKDHNSKVSVLRERLSTAIDQKQSQMTEGWQVYEDFYSYVENNVAKSSIPYLIVLIGKTCNARSAVTDEMIVARAQKRK